MEAELLEKTAVELKPLMAAEKRLTQNPRNGILVLDGKGQFPQDCAGKLDKIIDHTAKINPMEGLTPEVFANILQKMNAPEGGAAGNSKHFSDSARNAAFYSLVLLEHLVRASLGFWNLANFKTIADEIFSTDEEKAAAFLELLDQIPWSSKTDDLYMDAFNYYSIMKAKDGEEKQSIKSSLDAWLAPFFQNRLIRHWCDCKVSEIDFIILLNGGRLGLLLPESEFGVAGKVMSAILKKRLYMAVEKRGDRWRDLGQSQVFLFVDESQDLADSDDLAIIPKARSLGLSVIFATQNIESYIAKHGKDKTMQMMDSLGSIVCMKSSEQTYDYIRNRIGKDRVWIEAIKPMTIAFGSTLKNAMASPMFDVTNPYRGWMKFYSGGFVKKLVNRLGVGKFGIDGTASVFKTASMVLSPEPTFIVQDKDLQTVQTVKFAAFVALQNSGAPRRDVIIIDPLDNDFKPIANTAEKLLAKNKVDFGEVKL